MDIVRDRLRDCVVVVDVEKLLVTLYVSVTLADCERDAETDAEGDVVELSDGVKECEALAVFVSVTLEVADRVGVGGGVTVCDLVPLTVLLDDTVLEPD